MTRNATRIIRAGGLAAALALPGMPVGAEDQPPDFGDARFGFYRSDDGYLRLNLRTGEVAACTRREAGWTCALVPEERTAFDGEIARLQRENAALKDALLTRGVPLPNGVAGAAQPAPLPGGTDRPPAARAEPPPPVPPMPVPPNIAGRSSDAERRAQEDAEIDRMMNVMEKVWRRLVEMMMNLQHDMQKKG